MALWEYKVITSGQHGFATPALLEAHLNALGKDEWEIVHFQTLPNNPLAFNGLVRRSTTRDWTPPEIAKEPERPRHQEMEAPEPASRDRSAHHVEPAAPASEPVASGPAGAHPAAPAQTSGLRPVRDTERDQDPDALDEEDDWDNWEEEEDELPTLFEAVKPHMRRNQRGPGMSVALDYLAKRWEQRENDIVGALKECGFTVPETEEADPDYFEFEGDLYWVNRNNRGQLFLNTREKPRPVFRTAPVTKLSPDDPAAAELVAERAVEKAEIEKRNQERIDRQAAAQAAAQARAEAAAAKAAARAQQAADAQKERAAAAEGQAPATETPAGADTPTQPVPAGEAILDAIRPLMRRNRRGPGHSGSTSFLARALHHNEADLTAALAALGLIPPPNPGDKPTFVEIGNAVYWVNKDSRGGIWINGREKRENGDGNAHKDNAESAAPAQENAAPAASASSSPEAAASENAPAAVSAVSPEASPVPQDPASQGADAAASTAPAEGADAGDSEESSATEAPFSGEAISSGDPVLAAIRLLLKPNKRGSGASGEVGWLSKTLEKSTEDLIASLVGAGLKVPADSEEKPLFVEQAGEIFWFNKSTSDGALWVNAKPIKPKRASRPRPKKPKTDEPSS